MNGKTAEIPSEEELKQKFEKNKSKQSHPLANVVRQTSKICESTETARYPAFDRLYVQMKDKNNKLKLLQE